MGLTLLRGIRFADVRAVGEYGAVSFGNGLIGEALHQRRKFIPVRRGVRNLAAPPMSFLSKRMRRGSRRRLVRAFSARRRLLGDPVLSRMALVGRGPFATWRRRNGAPIRRR